MSVNLGHPAGHAHFFQVLMIVSEGREDIGIMVASSVDHFEEGMKRFLLPLSVTKQQNRIETIENDRVAGDAIGNLSNDNGDGIENVTNLQI